MNYEHLAEISSDELQHYGILGMKWGVKNGPPYPVVFGNRQLKSLLKETRTANISSWGKTVNTNICFITGFPGSGKSTFSRAFADKNTNIIHLDLFFKRGLSSIDKEVRDPEFMMFLNKHKVDIPSETSSHRISINDKFSSAIDAFGKEQYTKRKKVIVEGVELLGGITFRDKAYFSGKPVIIMGTNRLVSLDRALRRDRGINLIQLLSEPRLLSTYFSGYSYASSKIKELEKHVNIDRGYKELEKILRNIGRSMID